MRRGLITGLSVGLGALAFVLLVTGGSAAYQLAGGHTIDARVVSCRYKACTVAWSDGDQHGIASTDRMGARPGDVVQVMHVAGWRGVSSRSGDETTVAVLSVLLVVTAAGVLLSIRRVRRQHRRMGSPDGQAH